VTRAFNKLLEDLNDARIRAGNLVQGMTADELTRRPEPSKWSIAECLAHLNTTAGVVQRFMGKGIERGRKDKILGNEPFNLGPKGKLLIWIATPPPKFRMRAPKAVAPPVKIADPVAVLAEFMRVQDAWERLLKEAEGLDMGRIRVGPRFSPFRCRLSAAFPWMMAHQRRHLLQAENVKRQILSAASISAAKAS
jgi:hypothetical protein